MKKSLLLLLMSVCSSLCAHAADGDIFTAQTTEGRDMVFTVLDESAKTCQVGYIDGSWDKTAVDNETVEGSVTIPATVEGYTVVKIGKYALYSAHKMTSVSIPNTVTTLDESAFNNCYNLTSITIPENVSFIGDFVFDCSRLIFVTVEAENPITVSEWAFPNRGDAILRVPSGCKAAYAADPNWAFGTIMEGNEGSSFTATTAEDWNMVFTILDETAKTCQVGYLDGAWDKLAVDKETVEGPVTIPQTVDGYTVVKIGKYALNNVYKMTSVTIPNTVTAIDENAFNACYGLTSFDLPASVVSLGDGALIGINNLTSFNVAEGNTIYDSRGDCNAIIESATNKLLFGCRNTIIPASVTEIGSNAFYNVLHGCTIIIPSTIKKIDDHAFSNTNMTLQVEHTTPLQINDEQYNGFESSTLRVPTGCKAYYASATGWKNFGTILEGNEGSVITVTTAEGWNMVFTILDETAKTCQVGYLDGSWDKTAVDRETVEGSVTIPETVNGYTVVKIGRSAFDDIHGMESVTIPNSVTTIDESAFNSCTGLTSLEIPSSVTTIEAHAFAGLGNAKSITVAEGNPNYDSRDNCNAIIEKATDKLLFGCRTTIIPTSVSEIGETSFVNIHGYTLTIPSTITAISDNAINGGNVTLQVDRTTPLEIDENAIYVWNSILRVPAGCKAAYAAATGWNRFDNILEGNEGSSFTDKTAEGWDMVFTVLDETAKTCQVGYLDGAGDKTAVDKEAVEGDVTIPETVEGYTVVKIGKFAFDNIIKMTSVNIPATVTSIDENAFFNCNGLTSFELPAGVAHLGDRALSSLRNVTSLKVAEGNTVYDSRGDCNAIIETATNKLLFGSKITTIPADVPEIGENAFENLDNFTFTIPSTVTKIDDNAFYFCSNWTLQVENATPLEISENVFGDMSNSTTLRVPAGKKAAYAAATGWSLFSNILEGNEGTAFTDKTAEGWDMVFTVLDETAKTCQVGYLNGSWDRLAVDKEAVQGSVTIPETVNDYTVVKIGKYALHNVYKMTSVTIPNTVTSIENEAFSSVYNCTIHLPSAISTIGDYAFNWCNNLTLEVEHTTPLVINENVFNDISNSTLHVPVGCKAAYAAATGWSKFDNTSVGNQILEGNEGSTFTAKTTEGWDMVFTILDDTKKTCQVGYLDGAWAKTAVDRGTVEGSVTIPEIVNGYTVVKIGQSAFNTIWGMTSVTIPNTVTSIDADAFRDCWQMTSVTIPNTVTSIGTYAFYNCWGLTAIELPASVTTFGDRAFKGLSNIASIKVAEGNQFFDSRDNCNAIIETATNKLLFGCKNTKIPETVTEIGGWAFSVYNCTLTIPATITTIDDSAFDLCSSMILQVEHTTPLVINENVFSGLTFSTLRVPVGSKAAYQAATGWNEFDEIVEFEPAPDETTWTDSNGMTWYFTVSGTEARNIKPTMSKIYVYGENPAAQPPFTPSEWNAADMRFSYTEGNYLPTLSDEVYWGLKTLIFDVSNVSSNFNLRVMNGWWNSIYYDNVKWENGLNRLQITPTMAADCAQNGNGYDLDLMLTEGSVTINAVYYETISIPNPVVVIPAKVYDGSTELTVTSIAERAFDGCSNMTSITIPRSVTSVGSGAFSGCSGLTSIVVEDGNAIYDSRDNCNAIIEKSTNTLIAGCINTVIPSSVTSIGEDAFKNCIYLTSVTIPNNVTSIGEDAFYNCISLTSINIPSSITSIGENAFNGCIGLTSISVPSSVTSIGEDAFNGCNKLNSVSIKKGTPLPINENTFTSRTNAILYVPQGSKAAYMAADYWNEFKEIVEINTTSSNIINFADANVKAICVASWDFDGDGELSESEAASIIDPCLGYVFRNQTNITSFDELSYFTGLPSIGSGAFSGCWNLTSVTIPNSVTSIGDYAFQSCSLLNSVTIPSNVTSIGENAFNYCGNLVSLSVEIGNTKYDSRGGCNAIIETETNTLIRGTQNTVIPNSVNSIGNSAFNGCFGLTSVTIPNSVTSIGNRAFNLCFSLTSVIIPNSVTFIGDYAFSGCWSLTSVTVETKTPMNISEDVFSNRANATLYVPAGSKAAYQAAAYWNEFKEIVEVGTDLPADELFSGTNLWAGYVAQGDLIPGTGLKVYVITKLGTTKATASQIDYMPQGVPVLLRRDNTTVSSYEVTSGTGTAPTKNLLRVFSSDRSVSNREGFILYNDEFVLVNEGVLPAGRVFLPVNNLQMSGGLTRSIVIDDDDATGIEGDRTVADDADEQWFDLQGRRLEQKPTKKGIYILNGRKVVVK